MIYEIVFNVGRSKLVMMVTMLIIFGPKENGVDTKLKLSNRDDYIIRHVMHVKLAMKPHETLTSSNLRMTQHNKGIEFRGGRGFYSRPVPRTLSHHLECAVYLVSGQFYVRR